MIEIPTFMTEKEKDMLSDLAKRTEGDAIEIGSYLGGSTVIIAKAIKGKVYAIDYHKNPEKGDTYKRFMENIVKSGVNDKVIPIRKTSEEAFKSWDGHQVGLVFIDGSHLYEDVKYDVEHWSLVLKNNGILALHDACDGAVNKVIIEHITDRMGFLRMANSLTAFTCGGKTGTLDKMRIMMMRYESQLKRMVK